MAVVELEINIHTNMLFFCHELYSIHVDQLAVCISNIVVKVLI